MGRGNTVLSAYSIRQAVGMQEASVTGENSVAIGANTVVTGNRSTAMGGLALRGRSRQFPLVINELLMKNTSLTIGGAFTKEESSGGVGVGFGW